jgi:hypothetical protein
MPSEQPTISLALLHQVGDIPGAPGAGPVATALDGVALIGSRRQPDASTSSAHRAARCHRPYRLPCGTAAFESIAHSLSTLVLAPTSRSHIAARGCHKSRRPVASIVDHSRPSAAAGGTPILPPRMPEPRLWGDTRPVDSPKRHKGSCARMLFVVAAASPDLTSPIRKNSANIAAKKHIK